MRRKKNIWFNRGLAGFMCMSLMVLCMLPVSAAERGHRHQFELKDDTIHSKITSYNAGTHTVTYYKTGVCACKEEADVVVGSAEVTHSLSFSDEGHDGGLHHYRGNCVCGYSTSVTLHCAGGSTHVRP